MYLQPRLGFLLEAVWRPTPYDLLVVEELICFSSGEFDDLEQFLRCLSDCSGELAMIGRLASLSVSHQYKQTKCESFI